jgi:hypothetical protein
MLVLIALVNVGATGWFVLQTLRFRELDFFLWASLLVVFALPFVADAVSASDGARVSLLTRAGVFAIVFNVAFWSAKRVFLRGHQGASVTGGDSPKGLLSLLLGTLFCGLSLLFVHVYVRFGLTPLDLADILLLNWRSVAFDDDTVYRMAAHRLLVVGSAACLVAWAQQRVAWFLIALLMVLLATLLEGSRFLLVPAVAPLVFFIGAGGRRMTRSVLKAGLVGVAMFFLVYHVQTLRYAGTRQISEFTSLEMLGQTVERLQAFGTENQAAAGELRLRGFYYSVLDGMPSRMAISWGRTYRRLALFPFPTSLMGGVKPTEYTKEIANLIYPERKGYGGTVHPLVYGESYANFHILGVAVGIFWGLVFAGLQRWYRSQAAWRAWVVLAPIAAFGVFLARGAVYSSVVFLMYGVVTVALVLPLLRVFRTNRASALRLKAPSIVARTDRLG